MSSDTITFVLNGEIDLAHFATAMQQFREFLDTLASDLDEREKVEWVIAELHGGSAEVTIRGVAERDESVERVVRASGIVASALAHNEPIPYSDAVRQRAYTITRLLGSKIISLQFETAETIAVIERQPEDQAEGLPAVQYSLGTITGEVETVSKRRAPRFVLYDSVFDRPVSCYFPAEMAEQVRTIWGKNVAVSGKVGRDRQTGRAHLVRDIIEITPLQDTQVDSFRQARGVLNWREGDAPAEVVIRRLRDAE